MARVKIYGKLVASYKGHSMGETALLDRTLEVYQLKSGKYKGVLWRSHCKGWAENPNNIIRTCKSDSQNVLVTEAQIVKLFGGASNFEYRYDEITHRLVSTDKL